MKFDYEIIEGNEVNWRDKRMELLVKKLKEAGEQGWEAVGYSVSHTGFYSALMKREIKD